MTRAAGKQSYFSCAWCEAWEKMDPPPDCDVALFGYCTKRGNVVTSYEDCCNQIEVNQEGN